MAIETLQEFRKEILIRLYNKMQNGADTPLCLQDIFNESERIWPDFWPNIVIKELNTSGLIEIVGKFDRIDEASMFKLIGQGYYEAERIHGNFISPVSSRILATLKRTEVIGVILAGVSLILVFIYPEFKEWNDDRIYFNKYCTTGEGNINQVFRSSEDYPKVCMARGYKFEDYSKNPDLDTGLSDAMAIESEGLKGVGDIERLSRDVDTHNLQSDLEFQCQYDPAACEALKVK